MGRNRGGARQEKARWFAACGGTTAKVYAVGACEDRGLPEANLYDVPEGVCGTQGERRRFRGGGLLSRSHTQGEAQGASPKDEYAGTRPAPRQRANLQDAEDRRRPSHR